MTQVHNERTKLLANALDRASTTCFTVGVATPLAGYLYDIAGFRSVISTLELALGFGGWLLAALVLHLLGRRVLRGIK